MFMQFTLLIYHMYVTRLHNLWLLCSRTITFCVHWDPESNNTVIAKKEACKTRVFVTLHIFQCTKMVPEIRNRKWGRGLSTETRRLPRNREHPNTVEGSVRSKQVLFLFFVNCPAIFLLWIVIWSGVVVKGKRLLGSKNFSISTTLHSRRLPIKLKSVEGSSDCVRRCTRFEIKRAFSFAASLFAMQ